MYTVLCMGTTDTSTLAAIKVCKNSLPLCFFMSISFSSTAASAPTNVYTVRLVELDGVFLWRVISVKITSLAGS